MQSSDEIDDHFVLGFVREPLPHRSAFVFGRCYRWNSQSAGWERGLDSHIAVSVPLIIDGEAHQYHVIAEFLRLRAKERETDRRIADLEAVVSSALAGSRWRRGPWARRSRAAGLPEFAFPEHEMAPATAWVLANKHGNVLTRFCGLKKTASAVEEFEIAFFDSEEEAEGVHDAMGLRGTVTPQLVNRRTLEPVT